MNEILMKSYQIFRNGDLTIKGKVEIKNNSLFVKIPDDTIKLLFEILKIGKESKPNNKKFSYQLPPYFPGSSVFPNPIGAHVSIIGKYEMDTKFKNIPPLLRLSDGVDAVCTVKGFQKVIPLHWKMMKKIWICLVEVNIFSASLKEFRSASELREKNFFSPQPNGFEFHTTFAVLTQNPSNFLYANQDAVLRHIQKKKEESNALLSLSPSLPYTHENEKSEKVRDDAEDESSEDLDPSSHDDESKEDILTHVDLEIWAKIYENYGVFDDE